MYINTDALLSIIFTIIWLLIVFLIIRAIWRTVKKFIFELTDRTNGTGPRSDAGKQNYTYTYNAGKPYENTQQKRKKDDTPPWEE